MLIKHKLITNAAILVVSMIVMLIVLSFTSTSFKDALLVAKKLGQIDSSVLQLRRDEKDFLARKDMKYPAQFNNKATALIQNVDSLGVALVNIGLSASETNALRNILSQYNQHFEELVATQQRIGLHPKDGLYGKLRTAVHDVEQLIGKKDFQLLSGMLQLRRNEKDFMLRRDEKYVGQFNDNADKLSAQVQSSALAGATRSQIINLLNAYQSAFISLINEEKTLGFSANDGLQGQMRNTVHQVDEILKTLVTQSDAAVESYASFLETLALIVFVIALAISILTAWYISRNIIIGIMQMRDTMSTVARTNDLTIKVTSKDNDELAEMATAFNAMITSFRNLIVEVNSSVASVNEATGRLAQNISAANDGVASQMQETDMVATAVTEMVATVDEIAHNTQDAASKAEQTNINAEKGKQGVNATIAQIALLSSKLVESEQVISALAKDSATIGSVLDVIRGIADQTNLLALNAAIEAARAGEQGRGFAVVADEVRTLASRTQDSTREIESIISSLQQRTKSIVEYMAVCLTQGDESAKQANATGEMLIEINTDVAIIMDMNSSIATAIQEQSYVAAEVNKHIVSIRDIAQQSGESSMQNSHMSEELSQQAHVLHKEVSRFII